MTSTIKVNNIQNQCGQNIINENSNTITIGASGDTIALASGASQTGFGRSGSVNWQTGSIKTASTFTAADGEGYFVDTTGNTITANLPAGSAGAIVAFSDYARNFNNNNFTISPNGSEKIGGVAQDLLLQVQGQALTLVYVDSTNGWINVQNAEDTETGTSPFIEATGGTISCSGNDRIHTFTGPGTFSVTKIATCNAPVNNLVSYVVVAGGGSGGNAQGGTNGNAGGAGAGGYRELVSPGSPYTGSPLNGYPTPGNRITVTATNFPITVGAGGTTTSGCSTGNQGSTSTFSTISSAGGGGGAAGGSNAGNGGSGGGAANAQNKGCGNTPPTTPPQGNNGGVQHSPGNPCTVSAGGGGAGAVGSNGNPGGPAGPGGAGVTSEITASPVARAGGGGGGGNSGQTGGGTGGTGGGGAGGTYGGPAPGVNGTANTGGGGGATASNCASPAVAGLGGSGIVIIRYKFQ